MKKGIWLAAAALLAATLTGCTADDPATGEPTTTALVQTTASRPQTTATATAVDPIRVEIDDIAAMTPKAIADKIFAPAYELYNGYTGLGFYQNGQPYVFDPDDTVQGQWAPLQRLVSPYATYDEYMAALRAHFTDELIAEFTDKKLAERDGKAYLFDGGRGVNIFYIDTVYAVKSVDYENKTVIFTATSRYVKDEYWDLAEDLENIPAEYIQTGTGDFTYLRQENGWVFADFMPYDRIGLS
ncbi:MAG: hypothetical protein ACOYJY_04495 [Acutalibacteraceae bacterium]|jgi:hypothetical protein